VGTWQIKERFLDGSKTTLLYRRNMAPPASGGEVSLRDPRQPEKAIRLQVAGNIAFSPAPEDGGNIWEFEATEL
jgi:hypothetical protein